MNKKKNLLNFDERKLSSKETNDEKRQEKTNKKLKSKFNETNAEHVLSSSFFNTQSSNVQSFSYFNLFFQLSKAFEFIDKNDETKNASFMLINILKIEFKNTSSSLLKVEYFN